MATHSSVLAWRIPGTGEPDGLPSMGSHRVGHDWSNLAAAAAAVLCIRWPNYRSFSFSIRPSNEYSGLISFRMGWFDLPAFCPQSFPESFPMSWLFASAGQSIGTSASTSGLPMNIQDWFSLGLTGLISLQFKGLLRVFSNTTSQKHQFFGAQLSLWPNSQIHTWLLEKP